MIYAFVSSVVTFHRLIEVALHEPTRRAVRSARAALELTWRDGGSGLCDVPLCSAALILAMKSVV